MNKKCFSVSVFLLSSVLFSSHALAQSPLSLGLGAKLIGVNWQGENNLETTQDFESDTGGQLGFNLVLQDDPYLPTDVTALYPKGIPVIAFFTGSHEDYNRPSDDPETLNYQGMERIGNFAYKLILDVVKEPERPDYVKVERKQGQGGGRASLRAYLGTVPDFVPSDIEGVKLSSVRAGGPADKAGLKDGDIIIEFAGQKITNIYDYTYALEAAKIGEPTPVTVLRDGKEVKLSVVPEVRK